MKFKDTFLLTSLNTVVKVLSGIVLNKIIAVYLGPAGLAMLGQFQNFAGILTGIGNASIQTGVVKKIAENSEKKYRNKILVNASILVLVLSAVSSIIVFGFSDYFAQVILFDVGFSTTIKIFSLSILFYAANVYFLSVLNGLREIRQLTFISILLSLIPILTIPLIITYFQISGVIYALILTQFLVFLLSYGVILKKHSYNFFKVKFSKFDMGVIKILLKFGLVSFLSGLFLSLSLLVIRSYIIESNSLESAGIWEAAYKISIYFNLLFLMPLSIHYMPKFSAMESVVKIDKEIKSVIKVLIFPLLFLIFFTYWFGVDIVLLLFSVDFLLVHEILTIVMIAEVFKIFGGVYMTLFMAKQLFLQAILTDIVFTIAFVGYVVFQSYSNLNLLNVAQSYLLASSLYFVVAFGFHKYRINTDTGVN